MTQVPPPQPLMPRSSPTPMPVPTQMPTITNVQQVQIARLYAASSTLLVGLPPPPGRLPPQISPPANTVTLRVAVVMPAEDYCTTATNWLQDVVNWVNPVISVFQGALPWLQGVAWVLDLLGLGGWLDTIVNDIQGWVSKMQAWIADIQAVINWVKAHGCGGGGTTSSSSTEVLVVPWFQAFIAEVEAFVTDLNGAITWLANVIQEIKNKLHCFFDPWCWFS